AIEPPMAHRTASASRASAIGAMARPSSSGSVIDPAEGSSHRLGVDVPRGEAKAMRALVLVGMNAPDVGEREPVGEDGEGDGALNALPGRHAPQPLLDDGPSLFRGVERPRRHETNVARGHGRSAAVSPRAAAARSGAPS